MSHLRSFHTVQICTVMFPIRSPHFLPPRCAFNILGRSRLTFMLDIYSSGRTSRWRCFPLKALSGRKWGGGAGGGGALASAGGHYSFRGRLLFKIPFLLPFRHTQHQRNQRRHFRPRQETGTFPVPGRADPESRWGRGERGWDAAAATHAALIIKQPEHRRGQAGDRNGLEAADLSWA